jgi:hypothetical protein
MLKYKNKLAILLFLIFTPVCFSYTINREFAVLDSNNGDTLGVFKQGTKLFELVSENDSTLTYAIPGLMKPQSMSKDYIIEKWKNKLLPSITNKITLFSDTLYNDTIGIAYPGAEKVCRLSIAGDRIIRCDYIISKSYLPGLQQLNIKDWHQFLKKEISSAEIFGKKYSDYKKKLSGIFYNFPDDSTWDRDGFVYCELDAKYDFANGEISCVLILHNGAVKYVWIPNKIPNIPSTKIKQGYLYYKSEDKPPVSIINNLNFWILSEKGIGCSSVEKMWLKYIVIPSDVP